MKEWEELSQEERSYIWNEITERFMFNPKSIRNALNETNFKPEVVPELQCKYYCYMPDCPRCQEI